MSPKNRAVRSLLVSFAAVFWMSRNAPSKQTFFGGALRDIQKRLRRRPEVYLLLISTSSELENSSLPTASSTDTFLDRPLRKVVKGVSSHLKSFKDKLHVNCSFKIDVVHDEIKGFVFTHRKQILKKPKQILLITVVGEVVIIIIIIIIIIRRRRRGRRRRRRRGRGRGRGRRSC